MVLRRYPLLADGHWAPRRPPSAVSRLPGRDGGSREPPRPKPPEAGLSGCSGPDVEPRPHYPPVTYAPHPPLVPLVGLEPGCQYPRLLSPTGSASRRGQDSAFCTAVRLRWLRTRVFGIPHRVWKFVHQGFAEADPAKRQQLERIRRTLVDGYYATLVDSRSDALAPWLNAINRNV